jgi:hypothetical protein
MFQFTKTHLAELGVGGTQLKLHKLPPRFCVSAFVLKALTVSAFECLGTKFDAARGCGNVNFWSSSQSRKRYWATG